VVTQTIEFGPYAALLSRNVRERENNRAASDVPDPRQKVVEFDEQPELRHTSNHTVVLSPSYQHELIFEIFDLTLSVISETTHSSR
jgi:hypothetical protein